MKLGAKISLTEVHELFGLQCSSHKSTNCIMRRHVIVKDAINFLADRHLDRHPVGNLFDGLGGQNALHDLLYFLLGLLHRFAAGKGRHGDFEDI